MRRKSRVDLNQPAVVAALRKAGATVQHLHTVGRGCPDIVVGFRGVNYMLEIKSDAGRLTAFEAAWLENWRGSAAVVYTVDDALRAIGAIS